MKMVNFTDNSEASKKKKNHSLVLISKQTKMYLFLTQKKMLLLVLNLSMVYSSGDLDKLFPFQQQFIPDMGLSSYSVKSFYDCLFLNIYTHIYVYTYIHTYISYVCVCVFVCMIFLAVKRVRKLGDILHSLLICTSNQYKGLFLSVVLFHLLPRNWYRQEKVDAASILGLRPTVAFNMK